MSRNSFKYFTLALIITLLSASVYASTINDPVNKVVRQRLWYEGVHEKDNNYASPEDVELERDSSPEYPSELLMPLIREIEPF